MDGLCMQGDPMVTASLLGAHYVTTEWTGRPYIRPGSTVLAAFQDSHNRRLAIARWGLEHAGRLVAHGPKEALSQRPLSLAWPRHRCLVVLSAWMVNRGDGPMPTFVHPFGEHGSVFSVAALWVASANHSDEGRRRMASVVLLTVPSCRELREVGPRQLAIVPREHVDRWLDDSTPLPALKAVLSSHILYEAMHYLPEPEEWAKLSRTIPASTFATYIRDSHH